MTLNQDAVTEFVPIVRDAIRKYQVDPGITCGEELALAVFGDPRTKVLLEKYQIIDRNDYLLGYVPSALTKLYDELVSLGPPYRLKG